MQGIIHYFGDLSTSLIPGADICHKRPGTFSLNCCSNPGKHFNTPITSTINFTPILSNYGRDDPIFSQFSVSINVFLKPSLNYRKWFEFAGTWEILSVLNLSYNRKSLVCDFHYCQPGHLTLSLSFSAIKVQTECYNPTYPRCLIIRITGHKKGEDHDQ